MNAKKNTDYEALEKIFHEPNRLAIMSSVCSSPKGLTFSELKGECGLTDGNLNRHLKVLEVAKVIRIDKRFVKSKPQTTVLLSKTGLKRFYEYLAALEGVLKKAQSALPAEKKAPMRVAISKTARA
jgi:DNA-binding transcriptional ArsR family regulator